jgi:predicted RND superfamily exporter protein
MKRNLIAWSTTHPRQSIVLAVLLSLIIASGVRFIHIEDDLMKMLPEDIPSRQVWNEIEAQFGSTEPLLLSLGREGSSIYTPETLAHVWDLTRSIEALPFVDEVQSLATMNRMDSDDGFLEVGDLIPHRDLTQSEIDHIKDYLERNPDLAGMLVAPNDDYTILMVVPLPGVSDEELTIAIEEMNTSISKEYDYYLGGLTYIRGLLAKIVRGEIIGLIRIAIIILALILLINLRSVTGLIMVMMVIMLSTVSMLGFLGWLYHFFHSGLFNFTVINSSMPVIILTIATADGVHIMTRFFREVRIRRDVKESVIATMNVLMLPVFLTSVTTIAGFLALVSAPLQAMVGYGLTVSFGIAWAWYLSVTFLPSAMVLKKWNLNSRALNSAGLLEKAIHRIGQFVLLRPKAVVATSVAIVLLVGVGITMIKVEVNIISFFKPDTPIVKSFNFLDDHFYGSANFAIKVDGDLKEPATLLAMEDIQAVLEGEANVGNTLSLANIVAKLHRVVMDDSVEYEVIPDTRQKVANLITLYGMSGDPDDFSRMVDYDYQHGLITATFKMTSTEELVGMVDRVQQNLSNQHYDNLEVQLSGMPVFMRDFIKVLTTSSLRSIGLALVMIIILSWIFFKGIRWGLVAVIPLASAILLNFGLMGWFGVELSHVTALFTAIIIGVGVDFAVHFIAQYQHFLGSDLPREQVSQAAIDDVGYPILLNVAAVSIGFVSLLFSDFVPINYMGGLVIISMLSCAIGTLTLMAAIIHLMHTKRTA